MLTVFEDPLRKWDWVLSERRHNFMSEMLNDSYLENKKGVEAKPYDKEVAVCHC
jgi:hypothetical protein